MDSLFDVSGSTVLVTGSSRGIGHALARGLLQAGATVVLNGRDGAALERTRSALASETGGTVHAVPFDVADPAAVDAGVAEAEERAGPLDGLVNNAGIQFRTTFVDFPIDAWDRILATNLTGPFLVARSVAGRMATRGRGAIVNICSISAELARPGIAPYSATKGALKLLTKGMCGDLAPLGIRVNALGPGYFATELNTALISDPEFDAWVRRRTPVGRWGDVAELVGPLLFLLSPASSFVHGHVLYVDGGMLAVV